MFDILRASLFTGEDVSLPDWEPVFTEMKLRKTNRNGKSGAQYLSDKRNESQPCRRNHV